MNELATIDSERLEQLVESTPTKKRAALSKALKAAAQHIRDSKQDYSKAFELASSMVENWWRLGQELDRIPLSEGGRPANKTSRPGDRLTLHDLGINKSQSSRCQKLAEKSKAELDAWLESVYSEETYALPALKSAANGQAHVANNSGNDEWYTPPIYVDAAREVMGGIHLDPASNEVAQQWIQAKHYFTAEDDALVQPWSGRVWLNPPYSEGLVGPFVDKLVESIPKVSQAVLLVNNATETSWFQVGLEHCSAICFVRSRIKFLDASGEPAQSPLQGQAFLYFGDRSIEFMNIFEQFGACKQ